MNMTLFWSIALIVFVIFEIITVSLVSIWFVLGSLASLILSLFIKDITIQIICFILISFLTLLLVRPFAYKLLRGNISKTNNDSFIGKRTKIINVIDDEFSEVKINGIIYKVEERDALSLEVNDLVEILSFKGNHLIIKKMED